MFVGNGAKVLIEKTLRAGGDTSLAHFDEAMAAYQRIFDVNCTYHVSPYPGIAEMLGEMKAMGLKLGVLSNKPDRQAVHVVRAIFGENVFDRVQGQREGTPRKPDPTARSRSHPRSALLRRRRSTSGIQRWMQLPAEQPG